MGSFLNVVAYRSIHGGSIFVDRSRCPHCKHNLGTVDLVPILSFVFLKGKCHYCKKKISVQYPLVELSTVFLFSLAFYILHPTSQVQYLNLAYVLFVTSVLIIIFITDIKDGLIPDKVILPSIAIVFAFKIIFLFLSLASQLFYDILAGLIAGAFFYALVLITRGKGMGGGDVKYALFLGLALGISKLLIGLFLAFLTGALASIILIIVGRRRIGQTVPFGPFLSIGALIALLWGQQVLEWYLRIY